MRPCTALGLVFGLILSITSSATAFADDESIAVDGNKRVDAATVRSYFKPSADGRYDEAARDAGRKALTETRLFDTVSVARAGEKLIVHVHEAPILDKVAFEGNK